MRIPAAFHKLFKSSRDWAFYTDEEKHLEGRRLYMPRGRMLGGSSSMNAMIYIRGHRRDYDRWREVGCEGWGWDEVLPFFKRAENQERGADDYHGVGGPLEVADLRSVHALSSAFVAAAVEAGLPPNPDFNGPRQSGVGFYQVTQRRGRRWSAADAYLRPALRRSNLTLRSGARATRVLIEGGRARGVEYLRRGRLESATTADGEVILCAGAIQSPQLLMLSGLGRAEELEGLGIAPVADLPAVGGNLQDHPLAGACYFSRDPATLDGAENLGNLLRFLAGRRGPLTSNIAEAGGFVRTRLELEAPDIQFHFAPAFFVEHGFANPEGSGFSIGATLVAPTSRGRVWLHSSDPLAPPRIRGDFLDREQDLEALLAGVELAREIAAQAAFDRYRGEEYLPGEAVREDAEKRRFLRRLTELLYHPVGTCRMGSGEEAVVDARLRVRGVEGLRVVDASVMPTIPRGNTNAPTIMIAEKAAAMITGSAGAG